MGTEIISRRLAALEQFLNTMVEQRQAEGLVPYPFPWITAEKPTDA